MDYEKINYGKGEHLWYLINFAIENGYNQINKQVEILNKLTFLENKYQDIINKQNGKHTRIISPKAKELATKEMMEILKMHVK